MGLSIWWRHCRCQDSDRQESPLGQSGRALFGSPCAGCAGLRPLVGSRRPAIECHSAREEQGGCLELVWVVGERALGRGLLQGAGPCFGRGKLPCLTCSGSPSQKKETRAPLHKSNCIGPPAITSACMKGPRHCIGPVCVCMGACGWECAPALVCSKHADALALRLKLQLVLRPV